MSQLLLKKCTRQTFNFFYMNHGEKNNPGKNHGINCFFVIVVLVMFFPNLHFSIVFIFTIMSICDFDYQKDNK